MSVVGSKLEAKSPAHAQPFAKKPGIPDTDTQRAIERVQANAEAMIAALSSIYQPLDADLTAIAALSTTPYGRALLEVASASALAALVDSFFLTPTEGNAAYQPLDADLTAIAARERDRLCG